MYCLLFCLTLLSLKLLVFGKFDNSSDNRLLFDLCSLEIELGNCDQRLTRYHYDTEAKKCNGFLYSGCSGNPNNFDTEEECMKNCPGKIIESRRPLHCLQEPENGRCNFKIERFYFDRKSNTCKAFDYGGCQGNSNRFSSMEECHKECMFYQFTVHLTHS